MKRITVLILIIIVLVGYRFRDRLPFYNEKLADITQSISQSGIVQDIQKEIFTSNPLRGSVDAPGGLLTVKGVIQYTNLERGQQNMPALKENTLLNQAAQLKLQDMFENQYFEHISPDNKGPADLAAQAHYDYIAIGENLALGNFKSDQDLVTAWMNSPGHRANIISSKFTEIGVAVGKGMFEGKNVWLAVQEFGKPASACPFVNPVLKSQIESYQTELSGLETEINRQKTDLETFDPNTKEEYGTYNSSVKDYNALIKIYNNKLDTLKQVIAQYNSQVNQYNECIKR